MDLYAENILDHYRHPRHKQTMEKPTVTHEEKNLSCGDTLTIMLHIDDNRIDDISWQGSGCAVSQAAMSILADELQNKTLNDLDALTTKDIHDLLGIPIGNRRVKCALLCLHTLKNALHTFRTEPLQSWTDTVGNN
jgi:nitrogen fixation NifU-like protein